MSLAVTEHFSLAEFASHDGKPYPTEWIQPRLIVLCRLLEKVRAAFSGKPITIVSGYRSPAHNRTVGGAQKSQHMEGRAADVKVAGVPPAEVHKKILAMYQAGELPELGGIGVYPSWVHVDVRPHTGHLAQWQGTGIGSEIA